MSRKLSENARRHIGEVLTIRWGTSRARDTEGYTTCSLRNDRGEKVAGCNGGGYDMRGTVIGSWIARTFAKDLCSLKPEQMPENSHWEPERARICDAECKDEYMTLLNAALVDGKPEPEIPKLPDDCWTCPKCGGDTRQSPDGQRIDDGRYFYGLTFHDPNYDPGKAVIGTGCDDRTLGGAEGETVEQAEAAGKSLGLERYQAFYAASSKTPTARHTVPSIDGACGISSVMQILNALGLDLRQVHRTAKVEVHEIVEHKSR
jgi:hypothetical protein